MYAIRSYYVLLCEEERDGELMKILNETPNILKLSYRQEKGDKNYGSCLWATFLFDLDDRNNFV